MKVCMNIYNMNTKVKTSKSPQGISGNREGQGRKAWSGMKGLNVQHESFDTNLEMP